MGQDLRDVVLGFQALLTIVEDLIRTLEAKLNDRDAEILIWDVQLFARRAEVITILREHDDAIE